MSKTVDGSKLMTSIDLEQYSQWIIDPNKEIFTTVEGRVVRQLLQTMLYENIVPYSKETQPDGSCVFIISGQTIDSQDVEYRCTGKLYKSFSLIRLSREALVQRIYEGATSNARLDQVIDEILLAIPHAVHLNSFINELKQTLVKDVQARSFCKQGILSEQERTFDELESNLLDAHSYHPCYKSRIGFSLRDNVAYGPEFKRSIYLIWLAVKKKFISINNVSHIDPNQYIKDQIGEENIQNFAEALRSKGLDINDYQLIPVHPWQWENQLVFQFFDELEDQTIVFLGQTDHNYRAQQSIRTLTNFSNLKRPYLKFSLSITNTSSTRILARHTVMNGPIITEWLQKLIKNNPTAQALDFVILGEVMGVSFNSDLLSPRRVVETYGTMGTIWRESIHQYLKPSEEAFPFNGLSYVQANDEPLIEQWVQRYGLEVWLRQLLTVAVQPIIHMLFAEGIGMESHGQNIILIHKAGWPTRIALKDFHDGIRYSSEHLLNPEDEPSLVAVPESHAKINRNSFILTDDLEAVRDFSCDCFFFICLTDIAVFLADNYQLDEAIFWKYVAEIIHNYQDHHPQYKQRFELFDVFAPEFQVEELTKRRLLGDGELRFKNVPNPLYAFKL